MIIKFIKTMIFGWGHWVLFQKMAEIMDRHRWKSEAASGRYFRKKMVENMIKNFFGRNAANVHAKEIILVKMKIIIQLCKMNFFKHRLNELSQKFSQFKMVYIFLEYFYLGGSLKWCFQIFIVYQYKTKQLK